MIRPEHNCLIVAGSSRDLENDMAELQGAYSVCAVNFSGLRLALTPEYWALWHVDWRDKMLAEGCPKPLRATVSQFPAPGVRQVRVDISGGSVALYAALAGLAMGFNKIITAGVSLNDGNYTQFRRGWIKRQKADENFRARVRGLSGFPAELLGRPDQDWLNN